MNERIKKLRKELGLSQKSFGERIGLTRDNIANIEGNRAEIKDVVIKAICKEFNVSETWLRTGEGDVHKQPTDDLSEVIAEIVNDDSPVRDSILKIMKAYMKLDDASKEVINKFVEELHSNDKKEGR